MSRVQAPLVTPIFPSQKTNKNISIRNNIEPAFTGLESCFPVLGTGRDAVGLKLATNGYHLATTFSHSYKLLHQFNHLKFEISKGQRPPCNLLAQLSFLVIDQAFFILTTRPPRKIAGGQYEEGLRTEKAKEKQLTGRAYFYFNWRMKCN